MNTIREHKMQVRVRLGEEFLEKLISLIRRAASLDTKRENLGNVRFMLRMLDDIIKCFSYLGKKVDLNAFRGDPTIRSTQQILCRALSEGYCNELIPNLRTDEIAFADFLRLIRERGRPLFQLNGPNLVIGGPNGKGELVSLFGLITAFDTGDTTYLERVTETFFQNVYDNNHYTTKNIVKKWTYDRFVIFVIAEFLENMLIAYNHALRDLMLAVERKLIAPDRVQSNEYATVPTIDDWKQIQESYNWYDSLLLSVFKDGLGNRANLIDYLRDKTMITYDNPPFGYVYSNLLWDKNIQPESPETKIPIGNNRKIIPYASYHKYLDDTYYRVYQLLKLKGWQKNYDL